MPQSYIDEFLKYLEQAKARPEDGGAYAVAFEKVGFLLDENDARAGEMLRWFRETYPTTTAREALLTFMAAQYWLQFFLSAVDETEITRPPGHPDYVQKL
jgi:hypothetical protein